MTEIKNYKNKNNNNYYNNGYMDTGSYGRKNSRLDERDTVHRFPCFGHYNNKIL